MSFYMKSYKEIEKYQINFKDEKIARQKPSIQQVSDLPYSSFADMIGTKRLLFIHITAPIKKLIYRTISIKT